MPVLKQLMIVASGCGLGAVTAGTYLVASSPAATRSLDYFLTTVIFLMGFAGGSALAGRRAARPSGQTQAAVTDAVGSSEVPRLGAPAPVRTAVLGRDRTNVG